MTVKTVVINKSGTALKLKEGNGGVYRDLATLKEKIGKHTIICNNNATYREYWVGTGVEDGDDTVLTITSDDCAEYQTVYIENDLQNDGRLKLRTINRGVKETAVVNKTGGDVKLLKNGGAETHVLQKDAKFVIKSDPEEARGCNYAVEAGGKTIKISTQEVAKAQRINISEADKTAPGQAAKLDMISRRLYLTEVANKTSAAITVKCDKGDRRSNEGEEVKTLQTDEKFTVEYDPKIGRKYWVEYSSTAAGEPSMDQQVNLLKIIPSTDFAEFERIDVRTKGGSAGMELELEKLEPRASTGTNNNGILSRLWRFFTFG